MKFEQGYLDEGRTCRQIATGITLLTEKIKEQELRVPVFFDGCVMEHLLQHAGRELDKIMGDHMENTLYASSSMGCFDTKKFEDLARKAQGNDYVLRVLDFRTKTGSLGKMIKKEAQDCGLDVKTDYTVLYDPHANADTSIFTLEFPDESLRHLRYVDKNAYSRLLPEEINGRWRYPSGMERHLAESLPVKKIKKEISDFASRL